MVVTAFAALMFVAPSPPPPCRPSQYGAKVGSISAIKSAPRGRLATRNGRGTSSVTVAEGDILCGGELVTNPQGSGMRVVIDLPGGGEIALEPGQQASIPMPGLATRLAGLIGQFDRLFSPDEHVASITRGQDGNGDDASERLTRVVPSWGPLLVSWQRATAKGPWRVSIERNGQVLIAQAPRPFARIDVPTYCAAGCLVVVTQSDGQTVARRRVLPAAISEVQLPRWLDNADSMEKRALLGAWLAGYLGAPAWVEQGDTLMWQTACLYPAVRERLALRIEAISAREVCTLPALSFKPKG